MTFHMFPLRVSTEADEIKKKGGCGKEGRATGKISEKSSLPVMSSFLYEKSPFAAGRVIGSIGLSGRKEGTFFGN